MKYQNIPYIFKYLTRFIYHPDKWVSGDTPTKGLSAFKVGDTFRDFHFDTTKTPTVDDFNWTEGDGFISVINAIAWHQHGSNEDIDYNAIVAQYIPAGYIPDFPDMGDVLIILDFNGHLIYTNNVEFAHMAFGGDYKEGWQDGVGSFREFLQTYEIDWDLSPDSYGELLAKIPGESSYMPDYTQAANDKLYGFKKEDYYTPQPQPVSLTPFEIGQIIKGFDFGNVKNRDVNPDLDSFLNNLPKGGECVFVYGVHDIDFLLCGKIDDVGAILAMDPLTHEEVYLYATDEVDDGKTHFYKGYQNLIDGKYIYPNNYTINIQEMNINIEDTSWNGRLIGAVLGEPEPEKTVPFVNGDILNSSTKIHFDTTKEDEFASYLASLNYPEQLPFVPFFRARKDSSSPMFMGISVKHPDSDIYTYSVGLFGGDYNVLVFVSDDFYDEATGTSYHKGFQNLDENGDLTLSGLDDNYVVELMTNPKLNINPEDWNNIFISRVDEPGPQPSLTPFNLGDVLNTGDKIHFDTTKGDELAAYLARHSNSALLGINLDGNHDHDRNIGVILDLSQTMGVQGYVLIFGEDTIVYSTVAMAEYNVERGFNNLDENGDYTLSDLGEYDGNEIAVINDTTPPTWNGIFIGKK